MDNAELAKLLDVPKLTDHIKQLDKVLRDLPQSATPSLRSPTSRLLARSGKRLRPTMVITAASQSGKQIDASVIAAASAIELIHIASLVHDDIIDASDARWGIPTISKQEGVDSAILVGDYLVALAGVQAASVNSRVAREVAEAFAKMCDGQSLELSDTNNLDRTTDSYFKCIAAKTAALFAASCRVGGLCAGLSDKDIDALGQYGESFGMAFQLTDDLLDLLSTSDDLGKPVGNDIKEGVYTLPVLLGLQSSSNKKLRAILSQKSPNTKSIIELLSKEDSIAQTVAEIDRYNAKAISSLQNITNHGSLKGLRELPNSYKQQALKSIVLY